MSTQQQLDEQFEDLKNLALVCFLNDLGVAGFLERDERGMTPLFHAAGLKMPGTNLIDGARCERVMAKLYELHVKRHEEIQSWLKRSAN